MNRVFAIVSKPRNLIGGALLSGYSMAHAAVPAAVTTALTDLSADALTVAGVVLAAIVAVYAFKFIRRGL